MKNGPSAGASTPLADLGRLRVEYRRQSLSEAQVDADPLRQFSRWFGEALAAGVNEPNAMTLATATRQGVPSARIVLLKGVESGGFTFFTNYLSRKGRELEENPAAALVFWWGELERQVRVEGVVSRASQAESDAYFELRPVESRIGAVASPQSEPIASRQVLEAEVERVRAAHADGRIPRPAHWGGFRLDPARLEFWQGRPSRLHDRIVYRLESPGVWSRRRLAP